MDHLHVNLFRQPLTAPELGDHQSVGPPDYLRVLQPRMLHDLLCGDPLLWAYLGKPGDGVKKLRIELVVGRGDLSPVLKLQTSSVIPK